MYSGDALVSRDLFSVEVICKIICDLKTGKAYGFDGLMAENLLHCHPSALVVVTYLCNLMILSGHVPSQFTKGLTFPIEKEHSFNRTPKVEEFRGITISPLLSKILEKCLLETFGKYFESSVNQFGFKKDVGCPHAIFTLRSTIDYFVNNNSTINICSLDVAKAFDRINHYRLYIKFMERRLPLNIIMLLFNLYKMSSGVVSWNGRLSKPYQIYAGVRQGGSLSPVIFSVYVDSVIDVLLKSNLGCYIGHTFLGIIMYADDLLLISGSVSKLQKMVDVCLNELCQLDLRINANKSYCIRIGQGHKNVCDLISINGVQIPWSVNFRYLGVTINAGSRFTIDCKPVRCKFYRSFNALYSKIPRANECVIISLVRTFCISLVMYSLEAICLNKSTLNSLDSMLYNAFSKIFKTYDRVVLSQCMYFSYCLPIKFEYYKKRLSFLFRLAKHDNLLIKMFYNISGRRELAELAEILNLNVNQLRDARSDIWAYFEKSLF